MRLAERHGSYLVRESDRKPGSYVLSYFGKTGINHFRYSTTPLLFFINFNKSLKIDSKGVKNIKKKLLEIRNFPHKSNNQRF